MSGTAPNGGRLLLGLDTATSFLALSLVEAQGGDRGTPPAGGREVASFVEDLGREHAARIVTEIGALLRGAGAGRESVAGIGVGVGPGSYTGVRVGVSTAVALGRAWGVPVSGSSSLLALLTGALAPGERGVAVLDARRGNVYALVGERVAAPHLRFEPVGEPLKLARADLAQRFPGLPLFEGAPDAAILARRALSGGALDAYYL